MKKHLIASTVFAISVFFIILAICPINYCNAGCETGRAISLRALQNKLQSCRGSCQEEILQLASVNQVVGYLVDTRNNDIVILGNINSDLPTLNVEDFIIALRSAWHKYEEFCPKCTILPNATTIQQLQLIGRRMLSAKSPEEAERHIAEWHRVCQNPQRAQVWGIPVDSRFAQIIIQADYGMKKIVDGSDSLGIPGLSSLVDMTVEKILQDVSQNRPVSVSLSSMNRFWFYPGRNLYEYEEGIALIDECQVTLLTEETYSAGGQIRGAGVQNPLAQKFAENFTAQYKQVAGKRPIYAQLENLYRFVALANIMKYKAASTQAGLDLDYLLDEYPISRTNVETQLPGRSNVKRIQHRIDFSGGYQEVLLWLPSCGGVDMCIGMRPQLFNTKKRKDLSNLRAAILDSRPSRDALYWDYARPFDTYIAEFGEKSLLQELNKTNTSLYVIAVEDKLEQFTFDDGVNEFTAPAGDEAEHLHNYITNLGLRNNKKIFFYTKDFSGQPKIDAFLASFRNEQSLKGTDYLIRSIADINHLPDYFMNDYQLESVSDVENINGRWTSNLKFIAKQGGELILRVFGKTFEIVKEFIDSIRLLFSSSPDLRTRKLPDSVHGVYWQMRTKHNLSDDELYWMIIDQCKGIYLGLQKDKAKESHDS